MVYGLKKTVAAFKWRFFSAFQTEVECIWSIHTRLCSNSPPSRISSSWVLQPALFHFFRYKNTACLSYKAAWVGRLHFQRSCLHGCHFLAICPCTYHFLHYSLYQFFFKGPLVGTVGKAVWRKLPYGSCTTNTDASAFTAAMKGTQKIFAMQKHFNVSVIAWKWAMGYSGPLKPRCNTIVWS